jgi:hypothetical protein
LLLLRKASLAEASSVFVVMQQCSVGIGIGIGIGNVICMIDMIRTIYWERTGRKSEQSGAEQRCK